MKASSMFKRALSRSFFYGSSAIFGKAIGLLMLPILTQHLTPADYGVASIMVVFNSLIAIFFGAQLEQAITYYSEVKKTPLNQLWTNAFTTSCLLISLPIIFIYSNAESISFYLFKENSFTEVVKIFSLIIALSIAETYGLQFHRLKDNYLVYFFTNLTKILLQFFITIYTVIYLNMGIMGVALATLISTMASATISSYLPFIASSLKHFSKTLLKELVIYSYPLWLTGLLGLYISSFPQFLIARTSGMTDVGLFNLANTFSMLIGIFFWNPFYSFWQVERYKIAQSINHTEIFRDLFKSLYSTMLCLSFCISISGKWVITVMAESSFHSAYISIFGLCIFAITRYANWYLNYSFLAAEKTSEILKNNIFKAVLMTILLYTLTSIFGLYGISVAFAVSGLMTFVYCANRAKKFYEMNIPVGQTVVWTLLTSLIYLGIEYTYPQNVTLMVDFFIRASVCLLAIAISFHGIKSLYRNHPTQNKATTCE